MATHAATHAPAAALYEAPDDDQHDLVHGHGPGTPHVHVTSPLLLLSVYGALLVLTGLTVGITLVDLGDLNVWLALAVAVAKAGLVVMYFMHLRWDAPFNGIILICSLFFVALFIGIAVMDSKEYKQNDNPPGMVLRP
jgi:cytochrome c oxidase subunit 4